MIATFFGNDALASGPAFLISLLVGFGFGFSLERAGFGSSKKLAGIFYFRDMTVLKVMFTAMITAMLGLQLFMALGLLTTDQIHLIPTVYGAQIVGGLIFGVGFVLGAWCPGTAAVGMASGRLDAVIFLFGAIAGSVLFNEVYALVTPLYHWGDVGVKFAWAALGTSAGIFTLIFAATAVAAFWASEWIEKKVAGNAAYLRSPFLKAFSVVILVVAVAQAILPPSEANTTEAAATRTVETVELAVLTTMEEGSDHIAPEELADRLMAGDPTLIVIDIRTPPEFARFHIEGAVNLAAVDLPAHLNVYKNRGSIVIYSNGMTHPAQAREALARMGFDNVYILTDGLDGFMRRVLQPPSLRRTPMSAESGAKVHVWRSFFLHPSEQKSTEIAKGHATGVLSHARPTASEGTEDHPQ